MRSARILILILVFSTSCFSQPAGDSDTGLPVDIPPQAMEQVVRRVLTWSFKPQKVKKTVYLYDEGIEPTWLPSIKNVDFRLLTDEEVRARSKGVYFFMKPEFEEGVYGLGFGFGDPNCKGSGDSWHFRMSGQKVKLWLNGGFSIGCGSESGYGAMTGSGQSIGCLGP